MKPELLILGNITQRMCEQFSNSFAPHMLNDIEDINAWLDANGDKIEAIATNGMIGVSNDIVSKLPNLKIISCNGVGYDAIDTELANEKGVIVTHTPNVLNADVANTAILLLLATSRELLANDRWVRSGKWASEGAYPNTNSIEGKRVGILGLGRIGLNLAKKLEAFNCSVAYHNRSKRDDVSYTYFGSLLDMAREVDVLVAVTPGTASTNKIINSDIINALGSEGTLINVARGSVVDEPALISALEDGRLGYAGLDVFEDEPNVPDALLKLKNVTLTPHIGSATKETRQAMGDLTVENLVEYFTNGKAMSPVPECVHLNNT